MSHCRASGFRCAVVDLNIRYIRAFGVGETTYPLIIGDHSKDPTRVRQALAHFKNNLGLPSVDPVRIPYCLDPVLSLPHEHEEIQAGLQYMLDSVFWPRFLNLEFFDLVKYEPRFLGISIMGPMQVLPALVLASMAREKWPDVVIVAGGSHITLKAPHIARDERYGAHFDAFLPGHSEQDLVRILHGSQTSARFLHGALLAGQSFIPTMPLAPDAWLPPTFDDAELDLYPEAYMSLPVQFTRGCSYARCTFCTYPAVEPAVIYSMQVTAPKMIASLAAYECSRFSAKDSLVDLKGLLALAGHVSKLGPHLKWSATTKLSQGMTNPVMKTLFDGGCRTLEFGIETIHEALQPLIDKRQPIQVIERALKTTLDAGIAVVINLIYGLPGETQDQAHKQLDWFQRIAREYPDMVLGSHNMLEINDGAPLSMNATKFGIKLGQLGPWAFSYPWNGPEWGHSFLAFLRKQTAAPNGQIESSRRQIDPR